MPEPIKKKKESLRKRGKALAEAVPQSLRPQYAALVDPLTKQDAALLSYLTTVAHPWVTEPAGVPLILGTGTLRMEKAQIHREFTVQTNASGFGFLTVNADGWIGPPDGGSSLDPATYIATSYSGGTQGYDVWYTDANYVGTTTPTAIATTATAGLLAGQVPLIDASWDGNTNFRMVAMGLQCWSNAASDTAAGDIRIVSTAEPYSVAAEGALVSTTEAILSQMNPEVMATDAYPIPGWKSGHKAATFAVPTSPECFKLHIPPAVGAAAFGYPQIGVFITGAAANQTFKVVVWKDYEYQFQETNRVFQGPEETIHAGVDNVMNGLRPLTKPGALIARPQIIPAHGIHNGAGPLAFANHIMQTRPSKVPALVSAAKNPPSGVGTLVKSGLNWLGNKVSSWLPGTWGKAIGGAVKLLPGALSYFGL